MRANTLPERSARDVYKPSTTASASSTAFISGEARRHRAPSSAFGSGSPTPVHLVPYASRLRDVVRICRSGFGLSSKGWAAPSTLRRLTQGEANGVRVVVPRVAKQGEVLLGPTIEACLNRPRHASYYSRAEGGTGRPPDVRRPPDPHVKRCSFGPPGEREERPGGPIAIELIEKYPGRVAINMRSARQPGERGSACQRPCNPHNADPGAGTCRFCSVGGVARAQPLVPPDVVQVCGPSLWPQRVPTG